MEPMFNGKLVCISYGSDTITEVTEAHINKFLGLEVDWVQIKTWELGDGDPGILIPSSVGEDDPRVEALWSKLENGMIEGVLGAEEIAEYINITVQTDEAVLLFVEEGANELYPEYEL